MKILRLGGWRVGATFEEGKSSHQKYYAFIFPPPCIYFSPSHLDSTAPIWKTFTANKYLLGIFSKSVPGSISPFVTFFNTDLCFHFIPSEFSLIWLNFSNWIIPGLIYLSLQWLGNCTLNRAGFKGTPSLAVFKAVKMMHFCSSLQLGLGKSAERKPGPYWCLCLVCT